MNKQKMDLPDSFKQKFNKMNQELETLLTEAEKEWTNPLAVKFRVALSSSAPKNILTEEEYACFHNFLLKFHDIPDFDKPEISYDGKEIKLLNEDLAKHIINEFRPIIFNQNDPTFYTRIHNIIYKMTTTPKELGTNLTILGENDVDLTHEYQARINQGRRVITNILNGLDLGYLYNGVLQHADSKFYERYRNDLYTGDIAYIYLKNAFALAHIKKWLKPYIWVISAFWHQGKPRIGGM